LTSSPPHVERFRSETKKGPDTLQVVEEECPEPKGGEVRVKVLAAGVSLPDVLAREGVHPETPRAPYTPVGTWSALWIRRT